MSSMRLKLFALGVMAGIGTAAAQSTSGPTVPQPPQTPETSGPGAAAKSSAPAGSIPGDPAGTSAPQGPAAPHPGAPNPGTAKQERPKSGFLVPMHGADATSTPA